MFKRKKSYGAMPKPRTLDEINKDYNYHATQLGHKTRIVTEIQTEIEGHNQRLIEINNEAKCLPPVAATETPKTEATS